MGFGLLEKNPPKTKAFAGRFVLGAKIKQAPKTKFPAHFGVSRSLTFGPKKVKQGAFVRSLHLVLRSNAKKLLTFLYKLNIFIILSITNLKGNHNGHKC